MRKVLIGLRSQFPNECAVLQRKIALLYDQKGLLETAVNEYTVLADNFAGQDDGGEGLWRRAYCDYQLCRHDDAETCLQLVFRYHSNRPIAEQAVRLYMDVLTHRTAWDRTVTYCTGVAGDSNKSDSLRAHALTLTGVASCERGEVSTGMHNLDQCIAGYPDNADLALFYKCLYLLRQNRREEAFQTQRELAAKNPALAFLILGFDAKSRNRLTEAFGWHKKACDAARAAKDVGAEADALLYMWDIQTIADDFAGAEKTKRELAMHAPAQFRNFFRMTDSEFAQYLQQPVGK